MAPEGSPSPQIAYHAILRRTLVTVGVVVWVPYMVARCALHDPFPAWWVLVVHIPCMVGALGLRLRQAWRDQKNKTDFGQGRVLAQKRDRAVDLTEPRN